MPQEAIAVRSQAGKIWSHIRQKWLVETPEEHVRQEYVCVLANEYDFSLEQMAEEVQPPAVRGHGNARADVVIWRTVADKRDNKKVFIVVECKSDNITISLADYDQGGNYANYEQAPFFVTHNNRETKFWRVDHQKRAPNYTEISNIPHAGATDDQVKKLLEMLKVFREDEFADLLHQCHNVIRNREHLDPAAAFDEIAKILFMKVCFERRLRAGKVRQNLFTAKFLEDQKKIYADPVASLFKETKTEYRGDKIFAGDEQINLKFATVHEIVRRLEVYDLSATSTDIKGIAFERFLGRTFRGDIGQFFTPRSIVEFMIRMIEPKEKDIICDPASGSGGFLIRFFEIVREQIAAKADAEYKVFARQLEKKRLTAPKKAVALRKKYEELQWRLDPVSDPNRPQIHRQRSDIWHLANRCIYGTDANDRMARTSKMNMIMHGDGHGGVHHHNGFLNVNGIFEGRFDIILTNPPFGANVEPSDIVLPEQVEVDEETHRHYHEEYGDAYDHAQARVEKAAEDKQPIASLFELPKRGKTGNKLGKVKTEILFIERCLSLLNPGGQLGIVLPEGIYNNPSLAYVREFTENRAFIRAVVSLPQETFFSIGASVKASLLFLQKFTDAEQRDFDKKRKAATAEIEAKYAPEIAAETERIEAEVAAAKQAKDKQQIKKLETELGDYVATMSERKQAEARALLKHRFTYPVFLYEAEKVGITATGEPDQNELYPNPNQPPSTEGKTCLELYRQFRKDPKAFLSQ